MRGTGFRTRATFGNTRFLAVHLQGYQNDYLNTPITNPPNQAVLKNILLLAFTCLLMLVLVEVALQILNYPAYQSEIRVGWKYQGKDKTHLNQFGFRGRSIQYDSTDKVILLLGDSQVEADGCPFDSMPEQIVEQHLRKFIPNVKVFSLGTGGYGNDQELLALQAYFKKYRADMVLVWITPSNDVWNNLFPTHIPKDGQPKTTFQLKNGQLQGYLTQTDSLVYKNSPLKLAHLVQRLFFNPLKGIDERWANSTMPQAYQPMAKYDGQFSDWTGHRTENLLNEKSHIAIQFEPTSARTLYGIELSKNILLKISQEAQKNNAKPYFFYRDEYPELPTDTSVSYMKQGNGFYKLSKKVYKQNIDALTVPFQSIHLPIMVKDWRVSPEDGHLNSKANNQVMKGLVDSLRLRKVF